MHRGRTPVVGAAGDLGPPVAAGFANGAPRPIFAIGHTTLDVWGSHWTPTEAERQADNRIWEVEYTREGEIPPRVLNPLSIPEAGLRLTEALRKAADFADRHDHGHWAEWLTDAGALLQSDSPDTPYFEALLPEHGLEHRRLTSATVKAWVFGGMGSWNDVWFEDDVVMQEYQAVTSSLYEAVLISVDAVTNV